MTRDLRLLYAYRIVSRLYFHLPVLFVFFVLQDFSIFEAEVLLGVFGLAVTLSFPLGARLRGRMALKWIIAGGELLKLAGLALLIASGELWVAAAGQMLNGIGFSLTQGTDPALLGKVAVGPEDNAKAQANTQSYMFLSVLVAGVAGAFIFDAERDAVFFASMGAALLAAVIVSLVHEPRPERAPKAPSRSRAPSIDITAQEEFWMRYYVLLRATTLAVFVGFLPFLFFERLELSLQWFGAVLGIFSVAAFVGARYAVIVMKRAGQARMMQMTVGLNIASLVLFAFEPPLSVALVAMLLLGLSAGGVRPLTMSGLGNRRGQLAGIMERRFGLLNAMILIAGGALLDAADFQSLMIVLTAAYAVSLVVFLGRARHAPVLPDGAKAGG
jgi:predicted MFS family arabinose efflux permease